MESVPPPAGAHPSSKRIEFRFRGGKLRDQWYGDSYDLIKWGILVRLSECFGATRILQIAYLRPTLWPSLQIDGEQFTLPESVVEHFRGVRKIETLECAGRSLRVEVLSSLITERNAYLREIHTAIEAKPEDRTTVFLDPDTGLEPAHPTLDHVLEDEVRAIWEAMHLNDVLVLYQHRTNRAGAPWIEPKRRQTEQALGIPIGSLKTATGSAPNDVALFYCQKTAASK